MKFLNCAATVKVRKLFSNYLLSRAGIMNKNLKKILLSILLVVLVAFPFIFLYFSKTNSQKSTPTEIRNLTSEISIIPTVEINLDKFSYQGQNGLDALTLLKNKTTVEQDNSGMVSSINGRKADNSKHEFWAFYVNDQMATVGSADYITKDTDIINWKIDTY